MFPMLARWLRRAPRSPLPLESLDIDLDAVAAMADRPLPAPAAPRPDTFRLGPVPLPPAPAQGIVLSCSLPTSVRQAREQPATPGRTERDGRSADDGRIHLQIDPHDLRRVRISGSMREVCAALDALIAVQ
ncbi:MAG: hypothetical protein U1F21_06985 [Sphaerotilus natans]